MEGYRTDRCKALPENGRTWKAISTWLSSSSPQKQAQWSREESFWATLDTQYAEVHDFLRSNSGNKQRLSMYVPRVLVKAPFSQSECVMGSSTCPRDWGDYFKWTEDFLASGGRRRVPPGKKI